MAALETIDSFGEQLIASFSQQMPVNLTCFNRPEPSTASFISQIGALIGSSDKDALARLNDFHAAEWRAISFLSPSNEAFELGSFGFAKCVHFGNFD
jgi:hypothetical protein